MRRRVLGRPGRYREVAPHLRVKEVWGEGRRYIVCHHREEAAKEAADREAILHALADRLRQGAKRLVGNWGVRRFMRILKGAVYIDQVKVAEEAREDGKFVLRTNTSLPAAEVELRDGEHRYLLCTALQGCAGKMLQAVGVALPLPVRPCRDVVPRAESVPVTA